MGVSPVQHNLMCASSFAKMMKLSAMMKLSNLCNISTKSQTQMSKTIFLFASPGPKSTHCFQISFFLISTKWVRSTFPRSNEKESGIFWITPLQCYSAFNHDRIIYVRSELYLGLSLNALFQIISCVHLRYANVSDTYLSAVIKTLQGTYVSRAPSFQFVSRHT